MNPFLEQLYRDGSLRDGSGTAYELFPTSIEYQSGLALYGLTRAVRPTATLEIGMAYGLSTLWICQALTENGHGHHTVIDQGQYTHWHGIGAGNVRKAGFQSLVTIHDDFSYIMLPALIRENMRYDIVCVDGRHVFDETLVEFFYADRLLNNRGYIFFHDLCLPAVRKVVSYAVHDRHYQLCTAYQIVEKSLLRRCRSFLIDLMQTPGDLALYGFSLKRLTQGVSNHCVIQKKHEDTRHWDEYHSF
jgi:predicted O-methyltransferase YrrM